METILMIALITAFAVVLGMLISPLEKKRELVPIRIRRDEEQARPRQRRY
ncbi:hypothetical protein [Aquitalea sp. LB_tupeE]|nr:hypothetical protein [Aquitalea sp. LB_tupeE]NWK79989.1 hypothetical protein [Aquitalea sp. LB_tupeE]